MRIVTTAFFNRKKTHLPFVILFSLHLLSFFGSLPIVVITRSAILKLFFLFKIIVLNVISLLTYFVVCQIISYPFESFEYGYGILVCYCYILIIDISQRVIQMSKFYCSNNQEIGQQSCNGIIHKLSRCDITLYCQIKWIISIDLNVG